MDHLQRRKIQMFVDFTGASIGEAHRKLQAFRGDINAAINSYMNEKENSIIPIEIEEPETSGQMDEDEWQPINEKSFEAHNHFPYLPTWSTLLGNFQSCAYDRQTIRPSLFSHMRAHTFHSAHTAQPRNIKEIPVEWKGSDIQSATGLIIEEVSATADSSHPPEFHYHFVTDDDDAPFTKSSTFGKDEVSPRSNSSSTELHNTFRTNNITINEVTDSMSMDEHNDIEDTSRLPGRTMGDAKPNYYRV
ncbi:hypothetical protein KP509_24G018100 [Ceratopteris richardii]|uniref:Uncharacterized protein n=1 Tax=Ceratopteris richardii TaxID=49495 RepID=A0A8T2RST7_CERRI|nr:hypothetical protein KP509_24G018100 [Ceratopteris richardii]KAH7299559.1 hypothetical protein KP509_24G018100 [Ceratopteris richardii]